LVLLSTNSSYDSFVVVVTASVISDGSFDGDPSENETNWIGSEPDSNW
jgi:hypothetical protein